MSLCERREILVDIKMLYYSVMPYVAYHVMIIECMDGRSYCYSEGGVASVSVMCAFMERFSQWIWRAHVRS